MLSLLLYCTIVVPAGLLTRLVRDPLHRRPDRRAASYWTFTAPASQVGRTDQ
jgi:hypothetical protein